MARHTSNNINYPVNACSSSENKTLSYEYELIANDLILCSAPTNDVTIPISTLKNNSSLEAIVLYLKDVKGYKYRDIARLLNRDQRTIWVTYNNAIKKHVQIDSEESEIFVPISILSSRNLSVLEAIVFYLRTEKGIDFSAISLYLGKNYRTIWTVYRRAIMKLYENGN